MVFDYRIADPLLPGRIQSTDRTRVGNDAPRKFVVADALHDFHSVNVDHDHFIRAAAGEIARSIALAGGTLVRESIALTPVAGGGEQPAAVTEQRADAAAQSRGTR